MLSFGAIWARHFLRHNNDTTNSFQPLRVEISIFIWTMWKNSIRRGFVRKLTCWSPPPPPCMYKKPRNYRTVPRLSLIWCQIVRETWKKKVMKLSRRELCALQSNRGKCRGGATRPPPSMFRVKQWILERVKCAARTFVLPTHFGVTIGITQGFRVILTEVTP